MKSNRQWLEEAANALTNSGVPDARTEAILLLALAMGESKAWVIAHQDDQFEIDRADELLSQRCQRVPFAYLRGTQEFFGRDFIVRPGVLIPRPETHHLVETGLELIRKFQLAKIADLGCGSGCIAVTLALESQLSVDAYDLHELPLEITAQNSAVLGADVRCLRGSFAEGSPGELYDLIVSNPPYVESGADLEPEVRQFEPSEALFAGSDGLSAYRELAAAGTKWVRVGGFIALEIGAGQADAIAEIFARFPFKLVESLPDFAGITRVLVFQRNDDSPKP